MKKLAEQAIDALIAAGVTEWCVCAGARNVPLVTALRRRGARRYSLYEERSAGFFAIGLSKASGRPVAVVTTSGTAAAELLPAMVEAFHSGVPLIAVTADRPRRLRGTGAPQTIDQTGLFGKFCAPTTDLEEGESVPSGAVSGHSPSHWNLCFDEPLSDDDATAAPPVEPGPPPSPRAFASAALRERLSAFLSDALRPLVVAGPLDARDVPAVARFLAALGAPVLAEAPSGLRGHPSLAELELRGGDRLLPGASFDAVLRIGGVPCTRLWRDLEGTRRDVPVLSVAAVPFSGLSHGELLTASPGALLEGFVVESRWKRPELVEFLDRDRCGAEWLERCLDEEPESEPALVRALSRLVPENAVLYLGNSLPIREWDLAALRTPRAPAQVSRGANGIDGQLSTFLGCAQPGPASWALLGDLTTMYDLGAPWALDLRPEIRAVFAVINNGGGRIFGRMFKDPELENRHRRGFSAWAAMWELEHLLWRDIPVTWRPERSSVLEIVPDDAATERFWRRYAQVSR